MLPRTFRTLVARAAKHENWRLLWTRYSRSTFLRFYAGYVNQMAVVDAVQAVGGSWDQIGTLQFNFLRAEGLRPEHHLLDFGCGCLRGGLRFIRYLDPDRYYGVDISSEILAAGWRFVTEHSLADKRPTLRLVADSSFDWFDGRVFDFVLAQSVFTHMRPGDLVRVFCHVPKVMGSHSVFYATCFLGLDSYWRRLTGTTFAYPLATFTELGARFGLDVALLDQDRYPHPYGTRMLRITRGPRSTRPGP